MQHSYPIEGSGGAGVLAGAALGHAISGGSVALGISLLVLAPRRFPSCEATGAKERTPRLIVPVVIQAHRFTAADQLKIGGLMTRIFCRTWQYPWSALIGH